MSDYLVEINDLSKVFRIGSVIGSSKILALDNINLAIQNDRPNILSIVGESGSGKTTLAKVILRMIEPSKGLVKLNNIDVSKRYKISDVGFRRLVQPIFQNPFTTFSARKPVHSYLFETALNLKFAGNRREAEGVVSEALESVGMDLKDVEGKYLPQFSGGELQRMSIARALIARPKLIVADEPVSMIDASMKMNIVNLFLRLKNRFNISFIYITHDLSTAYYVSDYIAIMYRGNVIEYGPSNDILEAPSHPYTEMLMDAIPKVGKKWKEDIKMPEIETKEFGLIGCKFAPRCPAAKEICYQFSPPTVNQTSNRNVMCFKYTNYQLQQV
jgi:peptide/nickel transport system ATP-binding protein